MNQLIGLLTALFLFSSMIATPHFLIIRSELRSNGKPTSFLGSWPPSDLKEFKKLIQSSEDNKIKEDYKTTYYMYLTPNYISLASLISVVICVIICN
jgi:ABC-type antimicrobial peptide transport system permease subunit